MTTPESSSSSLATKDKLNGEIETPKLVKEEVATEGPNEEVEVAAVDEELEEPIFLHNLCILPPLQKDNINPPDSAKDSILLPSISPAEPVSAIRNALGELRGYAHITNYRLIVEEISEDLHQSILEHSKSKVTEGKNDNKKIINIGNHDGGGMSKKKNKKAANGASKKSFVAVEDVVSPYTSSKAAIKVSSSLLSFNHDSVCDSEQKGESEEIVLNYFGDLSPYVESDGLASNMGLRMVLERYDVGMVREHVMKTRYLLNGNAPCVIRVVGGEEEGTEDLDAETKNKGEKVNGTQDTKNEKENIALVSVFFCSVSYDSFVINRSYKYIYINEK
jgi:hypothetical protein